MNTIPNTPEKKTEDLIKKYSDEILHFSSYYKYSFTYKNEKITVYVGGDASDIYHAEMLPTMKLEDIIHECGDEYLDITEIEDSQK